MEWLVVVVVIVVIVILVILVAVDGMVSVHPFIGSEYLSRHLVRRIDFKTVSSLSKKSFDLVV